MRKNIIAFIAIVIVSMSLTACGNNNATAYTIEYREDSSNSQNQTQNQTSNDDSSNISEKDPMQDPVHQGNANIGGGESQGATPGTFEYYWEGEDYFDIEAFAYDNGCDYVLWADDNGETSKASAKRVILFFGDWEIYVNEGHWLYAQNHNTHTERNMVPSGDSSLVSICKENNIMIGTDSCQYLNELLDSIKNSN